MHKTNSFLISILKFCEIINIGKSMGLKDEDISVEFVVTKIKELNDKINTPRLGELGIKKYHIFNLNFMKLL